MSANKIDKTSEFVKKYGFDFLIAVIAIAYIFFGAIQVSQTGRTILEIIATSVLALIMSVTIGFILGKKGIIYAKSQDDYKDMMLSYSQEIEKTDPHIDKLDEFCDTENEIRLKSAQLVILRRQRIKYEDFINKTKEEVCKTKEQMKCWDKAINVKIQTVTPDNLLSETNIRYEKGKKILTPEEFERLDSSRTLLTKVLFALISGYFAFTLILDASSIIWGLIQVSIWIIMGLMKWYSNYIYVKDTYSNHIHRKINLLVKFNSIMKKEENKNEPIERIQEDC